MDGRIKWVGEMTEGSFFSLDFAASYDRSIELVVPNHGFARGVVADFLRYRFSSHQIANLRILDLGAGTGSWIDLLSDALGGGNFVAVDYSPQMLGVLRNKHSRRAPVEVDVVDGDFTQESCWKSIERPEDGFDLVVSAYALHHVSMQARRFVHRNVAQALRLGGLFVNLDLFAYSDSEVSSWAIDLDLDWIRSQHEKPGHSERLRHDWVYKGDGDKERQRRSGRQWLEHYHTSNHPIVLEDELDLLGSVGGFSQSLVLYRAIQSAVVVTEKAKEVADDVG